MLDSGQVLGARDRGGWRALPGLAGVVKGPRSAPASSGDVAPAGEMQ
jgi:hypothetical protein